MNRIIAGPEVVEWVAQHVGIGNPCLATGLGVTRNGRIIAGVTYYNFRWPDIHIGLHAVDPSWSSRGFFRVMMRYPFEQLQCHRVTATTDARNIDVISFIERWGFILEGRLRKALPDSDLLIYGLLREECRWL